MEKAPFVKLSRPAMGTYFEVILFGEKESYLRSAAEEALDEIERLEEQMSFYLPTSEISGINDRAYCEPVKVEPRLFYLIQRAKQIGVETEEAFDITIGSLLQCWRFFGDNPRPLDLSALEEGKSRVGLKNLLLDEKEKTVKFAIEGMSLDLGGIGKGYAIERVAKLLCEKSITSALIHGGTSTFYAIGSPPNQKAWKIGLRHPADPEQRIAFIQLRNKALSVSRVDGRVLGLQKGQSEEWEMGNAESGTLNAKRRAGLVSGRNAKKMKVRNTKKSFASNYGHILDPLTGFPAKKALAAFVVAPCPVEADALSTAFVVLGPEKTRCFCQTHPEIEALLVTESKEGGGLTFANFGIMFEEQKMKLDVQL